MNLKRLNNLILPIAIAPFPYLPSVPSTDWVRSESKGLCPVRSFIGVALLLFFLSVVASSPEPDLLLAPAPS
jgi:hypothetical protein